MIKSFKQFESFSHIESITKEEMSSVEDIFCDLIDSENATIVNVEILEGNINREREALSRLDFLDKLYRKLKWRSREIDREFLRLVGKNTFRVEIEIPVSDNTWSIISPLVTRVISYNSNFHYSAWSSGHPFLADDGTKMFKYELFFLKNKEEITKIGNELIIGD